MAENNNNMTAGEECQQTAKILSTFIDSSRNGGSIPPHFIVNSMGIAVVKGCYGVAVVRLKTGDWSAPCAFALTSPQNSVAPLQETVLLFMTERSIVGLVANQQISLGETHSFAPGPLTSDPIVPGVDFYVWIRFNNGFTPEALIAKNLLGWSVMEDKRRHRKWHGETVTWYDVLTNKISVDRSSIGNALYLVLNLGAGKGVGADKSRKNYVDLEALVGPRPSDVAASASGSSRLNHTQFNVPATTSIPTSMTLSHQNPVSNGTNQQYTTFPGGNQQPLQSQQSPASIVPKNSMQPLNPNFMQQSQPPFIPTSSTQQQQQSQTMANSFLPAGSMQPTAGIPNQINVMKTTTTTIIGTGPASMMPFQNSPQQYQQQQMMNSTHQNMNLNQPGSGMNVQSQQMMHPQFQPQGQYTGQISAPLIPVPNNHQQGMSANNMMTMNQTGMNSQFSSQQFHHPGQGQLMQQNMHSQFMTPQNGTMGQNPMSMMSSSTGYPNQNHAPGMGNFQGQMMNQQFRN